MGAHFSLWMVFVLLTSLVVPDGWLPTRPENFFMPIAAIHMLLHPLNKQWYWVSLALLLFSLGNMISVAFGDSSVLTGLAYQSRLLKVLFILVYTQQFGQHIYPHLDKLLRGLVSVIIGIAIIQVFNPWEWGTHLGELYSSHDITVELNASFTRHFRLLGTMNNPNEFALVLLMFTLYFLAHVDRKGVRLEWLLIAILVGLLILTQSRTSLLALVVAFGMHFFMRKFSTQMMILLAGGAGLGVLLVFALDLQYLFQGLSNPFNNSSWLARIDVWSDMMETWKGRPFLGVGPGHLSADTKAADSQYVHVLLSYGILGMIWHIAVLFLPIGLLWKYRGEVLCRALILISVAFLVCNITNYTIFNPVIGVFYFTLLGLALWKRNELKQV